MGKERNFRDELCKKVGEGERKKTKKKTKRPKFLTRSGGHEDEGELALLRILAARLHQTESFEKVHGLVKVVHLFLRRVGDSRGESSSWFAPIFLGTHANR